MIDKSVAQAKTKITYRLITYPSNNGRRNGGTTRRKQKQQTNFTGTQTKLLKTRIKAREIKDKRFGKTLVPNETVLILQDASLQLA